MRDCLHEDGVADAQLDALMRRRDPVGAQVQHRQQVIRRRRQDGAERRGQQVSHRQPLALLRDRLRVRELGQYSGQLKALL